MKDPITVCPLDLADGEQATSFIDLLDHYARDPMGGGQGLSTAVKQTLVAALHQRQGFHGALALVDGRAIGLINCFVGFSTFAARPLLNVHDLVVRAEWRGRGVGQALLAWAEQCAHGLGCCKLTLEVLANNHVAMASYRHAGFAPFQLDPAAGQAVLLQKLI